MNQRIPRGEVPALDRMRDKFEREDAATMAWRILYCRPGGEKRVLEMLKERGFTGYAPMETVWRGMGVRRHRADRPLIPRYLFAMIPDSAIPTVSHLDGVQNMVGDAEKPGFPPDWWFVTELQEAERAGAYNRTGKPKVELEPGASIKVARGAFKGLAGTLVKLTTDHRAQVLLTVIRGQAGTMTIDIDKLELCDAA